MYDLKYDPEELNNVVGKQQYQEILKDLKIKLLNWQKLTKDPWICAPHGVLEPNNNGDSCFSLDNLTEKIKKN